MSTEAVVDHPRLLKRTSLYEVHKRAGAKIVEFAGYEMPVQYASVIEEHRRVRQSVGVFDVSHMGEVEVWGSDALDFVQRITTNDASKLREGKVQYSAMSYEDGGIVDDLLVYHMKDHFMLVVNASNIEKDYSWMLQHASGDVVLKNVSDDIALLAVQGPKSLETLRQLSSAELSSLPYYHFVRATLAGVNTVISRTGYTGELGFEIYFLSQADIAEKIWNAIVREGERFAITGAGLGARDTLRLEMGFCLYGNDIDQTTNTLEAGLGWITKLDAKDFVGRETLLKVKRDGLKRKLVGFTLDDRAFPRHGYPIHLNGSAIGYVTSGTFSPTLERGIGLGYVTIEHARNGGTINILIRNKEYPATIVDVPFVKKENNKGV